MTSSPLPGLTAAKQKQNFFTRFKLPLRLVLIGLFVLFTVGTVGVVEYLCFRNGQQAAENLANQLMQNVGGRVELYLNTYLHTPQLVNQLNANAVSLGELDLQNLPALEQHLLTQLNQFESISSIQVGNSQQDFRAITRQNGLRLLQANGTKPTRIEEYQLDSTGRKTQLVSTSEQTSVRNQLWYQAALFAGQPTWGAISKLSNSETSSLTAIQPVYDAQGQVRGVLASAIFLNAISSFLHDLPVGKSGEVFILEQDGWTIATSNQGLPENYALVNRFNLINSPVFTERIAARSLIDRFGDFSRIDRPQQLVFSPQGQRHFLQIMPFQDEYGLNWLIGVMVPEADFMQQIHLDTRMTLLLCAGVLTASVLLGLLAARCMTRSIEQLSQSSQSLAQGEWDTSFPEDSPVVELQLLAQSLNQMAGQLQQSFDRVNIALQESQEKFTQVFRTCPDAIGIVTLDGRYVEVNDAFVHLFGYTQAEVIGRTAAEIGHWVDLEQRQRYVQLVQTGEPVHNLEFTFRNKTGELLTVLFSADSIELQGQPYIVGIAKDITDRKRAELELLLQKALRETIYNESADAIFLVDPETLRIIDCNRRAVNLFEVGSKAELIGIEGRSLQRRSFTAAEIEQIVAAMEKAGFWSQEVEYVTRKGNVFWGNLVTKPVEIADQSLHLVQVTNISSRKQVEAALRQNEAQFQRLTAVSPCIIYSIEEYPGRPVRFEYLSPAFEEIQEIPVAEAMRDARVAFDAFHPDDREGHQQAVIRALETMQPFKHEWRIITPSGKIKWVQANSRPERRENGVLVWHGVMLDITDRKRIEAERKQAEAALQQSEARFQRLAAAAPGAIYTLVKRPDQSPDQAFYFEYISPAIEEINELTVEQMLDNSAMTLVHPDDQADYEAAVAHSAITLEAFSHEFRIVTPSGKIKWLYASSRPEQRPNGEIAWYGIVLDVSEFKQVEEALRQSETRLQNLAAAAPVNIYSLVQHPDGSIEFEYINRVVEEFHEISLEEFLADPQQILMRQMHPDDRQGYIDSVARSAETLERFQYEWRIITPSGKLKWLQARSQPERRENGDICWHGVVLDISDRKRTEAALRHSEEHNRAILSAIPDLMTLVSSEGVYLGSIRSNALIDLVSADINPVGRHLTELLPPEVANMQTQLVQQALATGEVQIYEQQLWFDGRWQHEELRVAPCGTDAALIMIRNITDRKQAEDALRHSEAALRRAQQVAHIGSWEVDVETQTVIWSEESFHIFGWDVTQPEPSLCQFYELVHPDDRAALQHQVSQSIATGSPYKTDFRIVHPDGSLRYVEARGEATQNEQGQVVQLLGTNLDITDRQQAELALRQSEATKNQILKAIPDLIVWMTADGTYIDLIDGGSVTNLYIKSEAVGKNLREIMPPDLGQARMNAIQQAVRTGEVQIYEQQFLIADEIQHEEVRVVAVGGDGILVIVRDITERKRAEDERKQTEAALLDSETRFRSAFWDAPIGMALIGLDDRWIKVNPMLCDMLDCTETELLTMPASSLVYPEDRNKLQRCIQQVLSSENRNAQVELRYCCQQGLLVWGALSLSLVRDAQAQPLYYVAQIQDITERQAIDRIKNEFISIVSHELRTPLTAIRGFLGLLNTGIYDNKPDKAKRMIHQALTNSDRLVRLVNDILDLERLSSGRTQLIMEVCDATALMRQAIAGVQSIADQATVRLAIEETLAQVWADPDPIIQTLTNLLSNAIKFSPPHSVITLAARTQTDSVLFSVTDQGRGIPADKLEIIFGRFQQVDVSDSRQKGGTGLGLAICQSIVQQHEGNIWAESTLGEGSTFYFTLPLPKGEPHD